MRLNKMVSQQSTLPSLVIITDSGTEVDDTLALMLAATTKQYTVKAVISVNEQLENGIGLIACYAKKLLYEMYCFNVPVFQGTDLGKKRFLCRGELADSDIVSQRQDYLPFIHELFLQCNDIYFLGIGATSVLGEIVGQPWFRSNKTTIVQIGGKRNGKEETLGIDISSTRRVFASGAKIFLIPIDTTAHERMQLNTVIDRVECYAAAAKRAFLMLENEYEAFRYKYPDKMPYLHAAIAFSALEELFITFTPSHVTFENGEIMKITEKKDTFDDIYGEDTFEDCAINVVHTEVKIDAFTLYLQKRLAHLAKQIPV